MTLWARYLQGDYAAGQRTKDAAFVTDGHRVGTFAS
jgi:hypothetical protein